MKDLDLITERPVENHHVDLIELIEDINNMNSVVNLDGYMEGLYVPKEPKRGFISMGAIIFIDKNSRTMCVANYSHTIMYAKLLYTKDSSRSFLSYYNELVNTCNFSKFGVLIRLISDIEVEIHAPSKLNSFQADCICKFLEELSSYGDRIVNIFYSRNDFFGDPIYETDSYNDAYKDALSFYNTKNIK